MSRPPSGSTNFDTEKAIPQKRLQPFLEFFGILITRQYTTPWRVKQAGDMPAQSNRIWNDLYINTVNGSHALAWKSIPEQDQCGTAPIEGHGRVVGNSTLIQIPFFQHPCEWYFVQFIFAFTV
jgi:hypothetical protein